jgi:hypothetical protein
MMSYDFPRIDPSVKEDWTEALRSGDYEQTDSRLDNGHAQCCLGVLCDIADLDWELDGEGNRIYGKFIEETDSIFGGTHTYLQDDTDVSLPDFFREEIGLTYEAQAALIELNDEFNYSFDEIADWIDVYL